MVDTLTSLRAARARLTKKIQAELDRKYIGQLITIPKGPYKGRTAKVLGVTESQGDVYLRVGIYRLRGMGFKGQEEYIDTVGSEHYFKPEQVLIWNT